MKLISVGTFVLTSLVMLGCAATDPSDGSEDTADDNDALGAKKGVDYAWGRPSIGSLHAGGYAFAARYLSWDTTGKNLSHSEAEDLRSHGVDVVVVWESGATNALGGHSQGVADAKEAEKQAKECGQPDGRPIYFAVDFDASSGEEGAIGSYFDGVASVLGRDRTGVYGGYYVVKHLFDTGKVHYAWQTYAWSAGQWDKRAQLRQVLNDISVGGVDSDLDHAVAPDYGQWGYKAEPPPERGTLIAVDNNEDGRLEVFYGGKGGALHHVWEQKKGGWSGDAGLGGDAKSIAIQRNEDGSLDLFYIGTNEHLYHDKQKAANGGWTGQEDLAGKAKQIAVGKNEDGRLEIFYVGTNDDLYHDWQKSPDGPWAGEHKMSGKAKQLSVATNAEGELELFYVGTNDELYHDWQGGPGGKFVGEHHLPGKAKQIAVGQNADGRLELFYVGTDEHIYHNWQTAPGAAWAGQHELAGRAKELQVIQNSKKELELFYVGTDDGLYHNWQKSAGGGWDGQEGLGGKAEQIAIGMNDDGRLELFYMGTNGKLYHNWQEKPAADWHGQQEL